MNNKERKEMSYFPTEGLDKAVKAEFGEETECETGYNIISMRHVTTFKAKGPLRKQINLFIKGFAAGNRELADRIDAMQK